jgi:hypothetical protein
VEKWGTPIEQVPIQKAVDTGITYSPYYGEWDACLECNLSIDKWVLGRYPTWLKEHAIAYSRAKTSIEMHRQQEIDRASEREARKNARRGR